MNNAEITRLLIDMQRQLAIQEERLLAAHLSIERMSKELQDANVDIRDMKSMANRWKGGFLVLAGLGGVVGWLLSTWHNIVAMFRI